MKGQMAQKDQAAVLREKFSQNSLGNVEPGFGGIRSLSFTSGKGGVGKTTVVTNLAVQLAQLGLKVLLLDADLGLANIDIMLNLSAKLTIEDVLSGNESIENVILEGPAGIHLLPSSSGVSEMSDLSKEQQMSMLRELSGLKTEYDYLLIDTGAGIASGVLRFNAAADEICVITNTEPTAMTDAYALMKVMATKYQINRFNLIVNQSSAEEAKKVFWRLKTVFQQFLSVDLIFIGNIPRDIAITRAVQKQTPLSIIAPNSLTTRAFRSMANHINTHIGESYPEDSKQTFWQKLGSWKRK